MKTRTHLLGCNNALFDTVNVESVDGEDAVSSGAVDEHPTKAM
jgi:hypothetical protein